MLFAGGVTFSSRQRWASAIRACADIPLNQSAKNEISPTNCGTTTDQLIPDGNAHI